MRIRHRVAALTLCASSACTPGATTSSQATTRSAAPPPPAEAHFIAEDGSPMPEYEPVWAMLYAFYGDATPRRVTVSIVDGSGGRFEADRLRVVLGRDELKVSGHALVAHETSHLCAAALTSGVSATEPFRFLDEGLASILEARVARREAEYAEEALAIAASELGRQRVSFALAQSWSTYFGDWRGDFPSNGRGASRNFDAYRVGASFCLWVTRRYGDAKLRELLAAIGQTKSLDAASVTALGRPARDVEGDWRAYLSAVTLPDDTPSIVELVPSDGSADVPTDLGELTARFGVPMNRSIVNVGADCATGVCFTNASWTSPTVLTIRLPTGLEKGRRYEVRLGVEGHPLRSRFGRELPVTVWRFTTRG